MKKRRKNASVKHSIASTLYREAVCVCACVCSSYPKSITKISHALTMWFSMYVHHHTYDFSYYSTFSISHWLSLLVLCTTVLLLLWLLPLSQIHYQYNQHSYRFSDTTGSEYTEYFITILLDIHTHTHSHTYFYTNTYSMLSYHHAHAMYQKMNKNKKQVEK